MYAAAYNTNPDVIFTLILAGANGLLPVGANVKAQNKYGSTPLMWAAQYNQNPEVITALLKAGADVKAKDSVGKTALDYAQQNVKLKGTNAFKKLEEASK
jgi:ankyrin repeat protein